MRPIAIPLFIFLFVFTASARADEIKAGDLHIKAAWARATPKGASVGGAYLTITNSGTAPDRLVGGSAAVGKFELHEMSMDKGVMKMRALPNGIEIKPGQTVELKPGGYHIMLTGLKAPLTKGQQVKATLDFEKAGKVDVEFSVQGVGAQNAGGGGMPAHSGGSMGSMGGMKMK